MPIGSFTALLDPCTTTYANKAGGEGQFANSDLSHVQITKAVSSSTLQSHNTTEPLSAAESLWTNSFGPAIVIGSTTGYEIDSSAAQWTSIPRFIKLKLPGESVERFFAVSDVHHSTPKSNRGACEIDALPNGLQTLTKRETVHFRANSGNAFLNLTFTQSGMRGFVSGPGVAYKINTLNDKNWLLNADMKFEEGLSDESNVESLSPSAGPVFICPEIPRFDPIDIAIFYTAAAEAAVTQMGGDIEGEIQTYVAENNAALANSINVPTRLNPVVIEQTDFVESSGSIGFARAEFSGYLRVTQIPEQLNVDIIALIAVSSTQDFCTGVATSPRDFNRVISLQNELTSATNPECFNSPAMTFAHEIGHNLGGQHNPGAIGQLPPPPPPPYDDSTAPFPYSFGHWFIDDQTDEGFSSIMSGRAECSAGPQGLFCTTLPYYSTPNAQINGQPLGILDERDNSRGFECYAPHIALRRTVSESILSDGFEAFTL